MFEEIKDHILVEELNKLRQQTTRLLANYNNFVSLDPVSLEVSQHSAFLAIIQKYEVSLANFKRQLQAQYDESRKQYRRAEKLQAELDSTKRAASEQYEYDRLKYQAELQARTAQIQRLKAVIATQRNSLGLGSSSQRESQGQIQRLIVQLEQSRITIQSQAREIGDLKSERVQLLNEMNSKRDQSIFDRSKAEGEYKHLRDELAALDRSYRELSNKYRSLREESTRKEQEQERLTRKMHEIEDYYQKELREQHTQHNSQVQAVRKERQTLGLKIAKLETEIEWRDSALRKYEDQLDEYRRTEREMLVRQIHRQGTATEQKAEKAPRPKQKPQRYQNEEDEEDDPQNLPPKKADKHNKQYPKQMQIEPIRQQPVREIGYAVPKKCRCERYREKLKEANEKIMGLLSEKCRDKIELAHLRKQKAEQTTTLDLDFENIVCL